MAPLNFLSANFLLVSILTISILSGINILQHCSELIIPADLDNNDKEELLSGLTFFHLLVLFTLGDISLIKKTQKRYKELKKQKTKLKKISLQFTAIILFAIFHFAIIYFITTYLLDDYNMFQFTVIGLITINTLWLLLTERYFWKTSNNFESKKKNKKLHLTTLNWLTINFSFLIISFIIIIFSEKIVFYLNLDIQLLWLSLFWLRSILDMIICRHFYSKVLIKLISKKGINFSSFDF